MKNEGLAEGLEKGQKERALAIARNLLTDGAAPEYVQKITGLSLEEIKEIS